MNPFSYFSTPKYHSGWGHLKAVKGGLLKSVAEGTKCPAHAPSANFTPNQKIVYPQMTDVPKVPVIPRGANASPVWGPNQIGQPTTVYILKIIKY